MVGSPGRGKMAGMSGFDWATYKDNTAGVNADLSIPIVFDEAPTLPQNAALDEFESMEGLSGTSFNDVLTGSDDDAATVLPLAQGGSTGYLGSALDAQGIALINGLQAVLGAGVTSFAAGDIILGGDGSDLIQGNGGDDIIDGDKWLTCSIGVHVARRPTAPTPAAPILRTHNSMTDAGRRRCSTARSIPASSKIVREIKTDDDGAATSTPPVFQGVRGEYAFSATADGQVIVTHAVEDCARRHRPPAQHREGAVRRRQRAQHHRRHARTTTSAERHGAGRPDPRPRRRRHAQRRRRQRHPRRRRRRHDVNDRRPTPTTSTPAAIGNYNGTTNLGAGLGRERRRQRRHRPPARSTSTTATTRCASTAATAPARRRDRSRARSNLSAPRRRRPSAYSAKPDNLDAGETVTVLFAADGVNFVLLRHDHRQRRHGNDYTIDARPGRSRATQRSASSRRRSTHGDEVVDDRQPRRSASRSSLNAGVDTLNGGLGDDTYSFALGDGNDIINEARQRHQRRHGGSHLDPGAEHRDRSGDRPADPDDQLAQRHRQQHRHQDRRPGDQLQPADRHASRPSRWPATSPAPMPRPASSASTSTAPATQATCSAPTTT